MKTVFRIVGFLEGLSYLLLLFVAVPMKYFGGDESYVKMLGMPHGMLFIGFIILAFLIRSEMKWSNKVFFIVLISSLIPFGTFYIDKKYVN